jgi:selenocysteine lyase/cysteine desulfurase
MLGHSTSMLLQMLGTAYESIVTKDDEIIAMDMAHESNFGPWERLAKATGAKLIKWMPDRSDKVCNAFYSTGPICTR